jgi:antagonist of KipI
LLEALKIIKPGALATIQDVGRPGLRRYGIPPSGAMDQFSYSAANSLVGNRSGAAAIEITLTGFIADAIVPLTVAVTGGNFSPQINDRPAAMWKALRLAAGDRLSLPKRVDGCRAYLAIRGGIHNIELLQSRSVFSKGQMGRPLVKDDIVCIETQLVDLPHEPREFPANSRPSFSPPHTIRVILGPQSDHFTPRGIETFLNSEYRLSPQSDRQGLRTIGPPVEFATGPDIITDPTPLGAVQVPGDGQPIILHRDGQVTGGYAKIAVAAAADLDRCAQIFPGDAIRFEAISREHALQLTRLVT